MACVLFVVRKVDTAVRNLNWGQRWRGGEGGMGGEGKKAETSVQLSRGYVFYFTNYKRKTRQKKPALYYTNRKE